MHTHWKTPFQRGAILSALLASSFAAQAESESVEKNLEKLNLPDGFNISIFAEVEGARQMALGQSTGTVFVGTRDKYVYAVVDKDKDRVAEKVVPILDDLNVGNGVAMHQGFLYVAEQNRIARYPAPGFDLNLPFKQMREVIYDQLPDLAHHGWRYSKFGPDNKLYVTVGAPCNICEVNGLEGSIIRMNADGTEAEIVAHGVRNSVGLAFQPATDHLYFTDNNTDMMGDDDPAGELNVMTEAGQHFGFPYYAGGHSRHADWKDKTPPESVEFPVVEFQAHTANLGLTFYTGKQFPNTYQNSAIIAQHGSWNRSSPVGYQLMQVSFDENNQVSKSEVFIDGWLNDGEAWGRPTDVLQMPDGSLLVSDDFNGVIYRISYGDTPQTAKTTATAVTGLIATQQDLVMPESVIADAEGRLYITEIGEFGKAGDGKVTVIDTDGSRRTLVDGLDDPKGIDLFERTLYVADITKLIKITLDGKAELIADTDDFPGTATFLNDVEVDGAGNVYISDSGDDNGQHAGVYKITPDGTISEILTAASAIQRPNGLLMDGVDQLLVADFGSGILYRLDLSSGSLSALNQGFGGADGLVRDANGSLYVSDWKNGKVWRLTDPKATPILISDNFTAAADISLSIDGTSLLVPDMKAGTLIPLPLR